MEDKATLMESLFERAEVYAKTNVELFKLKAIDKSADIVSTLVPKFVIVVIISLIAIMVNIGLGLWIGELIGKSYFGFFIVAGFYVILAIIVYMFKNQLIKSPVNDLMISLLMKEKLT